MNDLKSKKVAILGFGIEGKDLLNYLQKSGAIITLLDKKNENELDIADIDKTKLKIKSGLGYLKDGLEAYDIVFRSPGVYRFLPEIVRAEEKGVTISSPINLFFKLCPANIIGVTGTKGKGTTSTLIYEMLKKEGLKVNLAGNIGIPYLELLPKLNRSNWVILELSSFQLIDLTKSPHIAVVLNISVDHLDWHKNKAEYVEAKTSIVKFQETGDFAILNHDYQTSRNFSNYGKAKKYFFSNKHFVNGCFIKNRNIYLKEQKVGKVDKLLLRGEHNWENICAATLGASIAGASLKTIKKTIFSFKGLEHRLELVGTYSGISFYDDSFSTNPQTTIAAVNSFSEPASLILGGFDKGLTYDEMAQIISSKNNIRNVVLIGDIADKIKLSLMKARYKGKIINMYKSNMKDIVKICIQNTPKRGVVLLSPAASSFDMFKDYKERGNIFKEAVFNNG